MYLDLNLYPISNRPNGHKFGHLEFSLKKKKLNKISKMKSKAK